MEEKDKEPEDKIKFIALIGGLIMIAFVIILISLPKQGSIDKTKFATCIIDSGAKMYGAYWCSHCADQKKLFGDSWDILLAGGTYVECDAAGPNPQVELCKNQSITGYPTWKFSDGTILSGTQSLETLAGKTKCVI